MITPFVKFNKIKLSGAVLKTSLNLSCFIFYSSNVNERPKGLRNRVQRKKKGARREQKRKKEKEKGIGNESRQMIK